MSEQKPTLLIVEDDIDIADMLNAYFRVQGYDVMTVNWGEDGVRSCQASMPDLLILDIRLPDIDGFEVARRLRANRKTQEIPIIFLTERRERLDRLRGLELRAEDYITKPFDIQELRLKVRNTLMRARRGNLTNPVTGLPETAMVDERLKQCLKQTDWAVLVVSLLNLDVFREAYGFVASDDLVRSKCSPSARRLASERSKCCSSSSKPIVSGASTRSVCSSNSCPVSSPSSTASDRFFTAPS